MLFVHCIVAGWKLLAHAWFTYWRFGCRVDFFGIITSLASWGVMVLHGFVVVEGSSGGF